MSTKVMGGFALTCRICWGHGSICKACRASGVQHVDRPARMPRQELTLTPLELAELRLEALESGLAGPDSRDAAVLRRRLSSLAALNAVQQHEIDTLKYNLARAEQRARAAERGESRAHARLRRGVA